MENSASISTSDTAVTPSASKLVVSSDSTSTTTPLSEDITTESKHRAGKAKYDLFSNSDDHSDILAQLRLTLPTDVKTDNNDLLRFLRACKGDIDKTRDKLFAADEWSHKLMDPISDLNDLKFSPNILGFTPEALHNHPTGKGLILAAHSGFDREGRPVYWEKTGAIQANYSTVKKTFSKYSLIQYHILSCVGLETRFHYSSKKFGRYVGNSIAILDMAGLTMSLDMDSIWYMKQMLTIDQSYFPERLYRAIIINSPWYLPTLYNMFKPFIDDRTREKIIILGSDYQSVLAEYMDPSEIPTDYGGEDASIEWGSGEMNESSGLSLAQQEEWRVELLKNRGMLGVTLTPEEMTALHHVFTHPKYKDEPGAALKRELLEAWMQDEGVEIPTPAPQVEVSQRNEHSSSDNNNVSGACDIEKLSTQELYSKPELQVCDLVKTTVIGFEDKSDHHVYIISVEIKNFTSWKVRRRYREFDAFVSKLRKVVPALDREEFDLPPKVFFNKMAEKVVNSRLPALNSFLNATIQNCKTYGTAEQDVIFTFLDAYTNIISFVCSNDAHRNSLESHAMASVVGTVLSDVENAKEGVAIEKRDWQTHFVAAAITAWLLMLSLGMA